ncbi:VOC family protein [Streptomyces bambusae]|uniref:VOC family protein n=1 Tax=Streptomyces bambusae TaxID=1550616 RepID=UPI001CFEEB91|nr:VOC family protein [Streptomyces bambusae]MCB5164828.1 VOC family protein [Streptomyces bambusae]
MPATMIFVNLPVKDLEAAKTFWGKVGYSFNPQFSDETAACMVISDTIYAMLLTEPKMREFTKKEIADATRTTEAIIALSAESREAVDALADAAIVAGGTETRPADDYGFMYGRSFGDLDGHLWEVVWMDPAQVESQG